jgi:hypothetical protein
MVNEELCVAVTDDLRKNTGLQRLTCDGGESSVLGMTKALSRQTVDVFT